jgi:cell division septum initiation protein DivIVA
MIASVDRLFTAPVQRDPLGVHQKERRMSGGNGADLGQVLALLNDLIAMQREMRLDIRRLDTRVDDLTSQVASLREEVRSYQAAMVGHGVLISEHNARLYRVEQHLNLPPLK